MRESALILLICFSLLSIEARAQVGTNFPPAQMPVAPGVAKAQLIFHTTINPEPALLSRLQTLFASYIDQPVDLTPLLKKIITESAVVEVPNVGQVLYNPTHMLLIHLPENWQQGSTIRVATLEDVRTILKEERAPIPLLAAYTQGFNQFALLSALMKDADAREALEVVWNTTPRSDHDKQRMLYLLLRPIEQAATARLQSPTCRQTINQFVDDVRAGKRAAIRPVPGLTSTVLPTRFVRDGKQIILVLSDPLLARYHVIARFDVTAKSCVVAWERHVLGM